MRREPCSTAASRRSKPSRHNSALHAEPKPPRSQRCVPRGFFVPLPRYTPPMSSAAKQPIRAYSGIQPSGAPHLGNDLGAIRNYVALQENYESIYCIVE